MASQFAYVGDYVLTGHVFKFYEEPLPTFSVVANGGPLAPFLSLPLDAVAEGGVLVAAGGPVLGGSILTITFAPGASARHRSLEVNVEAPLFALEDYGPLATNQTRCAVGPPPYTVPMNVTPRSVTCATPSRASLSIHPLRISLNGQQFFATGLTFQYYNHPNISSIFPRGGLVTGATPVTVYGIGFLNFVPRQNEVL